MQLSVIVIIYSEMDISQTERYSVELKREVDRVSTLTFTLTCDLSYIASILFAKVNFKRTYSRKNYSTVEINPNCQYVNTYTFRTLWCPPFVLTAYCLVFLWYMINPTRLIIYENCLVVLGRVAKNILRLSELLTIISKQ